MRISNIVGAVVLAGCAQGMMGQFLEPKITLSHIAVRGLGYAGGALDAQLQIDNPNSFDLRGTKLEMNLDIEGVHFGDIQLDQAFALPKNDTTPLTVPVSFKWSEVGSAAKAVLGYGTANYTLQGKVTVSLPGGSKTVPFTQKGTVTLSQLRPGLLKRDSSSTSPR